MERGSGVHSNDFTEHEYNDGCVLHALSQPFSQLFILMEAIASGTVSLGSPKKLA